MNTLHLEHLYKRFAAQTVIHDVDLQISAGEFLALLGPSGCGKTTILRMIAGFEAPCGGRIRLGENVFADARQGIAVPPEKRGLGMVFQAYALWPHMTVWENAAYPLKLKGIKRQEQRARVNHLLEQTGLAPYAERYPKALSGGQQQRVALVRSLITRPSVILLDEPLANLDRHLRATMQETFKAFNRESGTTFIYVTHDQHEAMILADKIAVLKDGRLLQHTDPETIYQRPACAWLADFIGEGLLLPVVAAQRGQFLQHEAADNAMRNGLYRANSVALVRPEHVRLTDMHDSAAVQARVLSSRYLGERYLLHVALANGKTLALYANEARAADSPCALRIEKLWVLPQESDTQYWDAAA